MQPSMKAAEPQGRLSRTTMPPPREDSRLPVKAPPSHLQRKPPEGPPPPPSARSTNHLINRLEAKVLEAKAGQPTLHPIETWPKWKGEGDKWAEYERNTHAKASSSSASQSPDPSGKPRAFKPQVVEEPPPPTPPPRPSWKSSSRPGRSTEWLLQKAAPAHLRANPPPPAKPAGVACTPPSAKQGTSIPKAKVKVFDALARQHAIERRELDRALEEKHKKELELHALMHQQLREESAEAAREKEKASSALEELARRRALAAIGDELRKQAIEDEAALKALEADIKEAEERAEQAEATAQAIQKKARRKTARHHAEAHTTNTQGRQYTRRFFLRFFGSKTSTKGP